MIKTEKLSFSAMLVGELYLWPFAKKVYHGWVSMMTSSNEILWKLPPPEMKSWLRPWLQLFDKLQNVLHSMNRHVVKS